MSERIVVIGAGTMGNGIAGQAAVCGYSVVLCDLNSDRIEAGLAHIEKTYEKGVSKGKLDAELAQEARTRLTTSLHIEAAVQDAVMVVEAVPEDMELKRKLITTCAQHAPEEAVLASNTSSLSITEIASAISSPDRVVGMHFFNPVAVMKLVEIVRGEFTSDSTIAKTRTVAEQMGKECILVNDSPGFATSRLGITLGNEAMRMFEEGVASAADIDKAMVLGYRHPIGPLALTDLVGLDVRLAITEHLHREIGTDTFRPPRILRKMVRAGKLGRKSGQGFYTYD